jgi:Ca2+-binding RTX toxin-like protein
MLKFLRRRPAPSRHTNRLRGAALAAIETLETRVLLAFHYQCSYMTIEIYGDGSSPNDLKITPGTESGEFIVYDHGVPTTIYCPADSVYVYGGPDNDRIEVTTNQPTTVIGNNGADTIITGNGPDEVYPGWGDPRPDYEEDSVSTDGGNDTIYGDTQDIIDSGTGNDNVVNTDPAADPGAFGRINTGPGIDTLDVSASAQPLLLSNDGLANDGPTGGNWNIGNQSEIVIGGQADDSIVGGPGNDLLIGNAGNDSILGAPGNDTMDGGTGADTMRGSSGIDTVTYAARAAGVTANLDGLANDGEPGELDLIDIFVDNLTGGSGPDSLTANQAANVLTGNAGNDTLYGNNGADYLYGDEGNDSLFGGDNAAGTTDILHGGNGNDSLDGQGGQDSLYGDAGTDTLRGGTDDYAADWFVANDGEHDVLYMNWSAGDNGVWDTIDDTLPG